MVRGWEGGLPDRMGGEKRRLMEKSRFVKKLFIMFFDANSMIMRAPLRMTLLTSIDLGN